MQKAPRQFYGTANSGITCIAIVNCSDALSFQCPAIPICRISHEDPEPIAQCVTARSTFSMGYRLMYFDYEAVKPTYHQLLQSGTLPSLTELARHLGVSQVWVSRVLKGINREDSALDRLYRSR